MLARYYLPCYILLWWWWSGIFGSDIACSHAMFGLVMSCISSTNIGLLTSPICVQGRDKRAVYHCRNTTKDDNYLLSSWKLLSDHWGVTGVVFLISIKEAGELNKKVAWKIPVGVSATESFCFKDSYLLTHKSCYWVVLTQLRTSLVIW